MTRYLSR
ncbi:hypothetical protein D043_2442, partial [Vibrio parahaemolyticus EKP-021]